MTKRQSIKSLCISSQKSRITERNIHLEQPEIDAFVHVFNNEPLVSLLAGSQQTPQQLLPLDP